MIKKRLFAIFSLVCMALCALPAVSAAGTGSRHGDTGVPVWIYFVLGAAVVVIIALLLIQKLTKK